MLSPADAWPFPHGQLREDELADDRIIRVADVFAGESQRIRQLQTLVLIFGALVVAALLYFLCIAIDRGFNGHLKSTEQILVKVSSAIEANSSSTATRAATSTSSISQRAESQANIEKLRGTSKGETVEPPAVADSSAEVSPHGLLSTGVKAIASTTVAVIWVLVIAIAVITISIARAVLSLKPQGLESSGDVDGKLDSSATNSLPGLEFAKEVVKLVTDTMQGVRK